MLNISNDRSKPQEISIKDIAMLVDSEEQNWFKRAQVGKFLGLDDMRTSLSGLEKCDMLTRQELVPNRCTTLVWSGPKDQQNKTDKLLSAFWVRHVIVNSKKDKGKALKEHIVPRGFDAKIEGIQEKHRPAIEEKDATIALLNGDLKNREYEMRTWAYKVDKGKGSADTCLAKTLSRLSFRWTQEQWNKIIAKNDDEAEYPYISICGQHGCRRHKVRVLLTPNKGSALFADGDTPNSIVTYNF